MAVIAPLLLSLATACPVGCVGTATAAEYQAAAVLWRQRTKDERSRHTTTRERLAVATASAALHRAELAQAQAPDPTLAWVAVTAAITGAGLGAAGVGAVSLDGRTREAVVGGGLVSATVAAIVGAVILLTRGK